MIFTRPSLSPNRFLSLLGLGFLLWGCGEQSQKETLTVAETEGIARPLEYVEVTLPGHTEKMLSLQEQGSETSILAQRMGNQYLFPVSLDAHTQKTYTITPTDSILSAGLKVSGKGMDLSLENTYFRASFSIPKNNPESGLYPGQLSTLYLKKKGVLLERDENDIHWSPNFQRDGVDYKTMGHLNNEETSITANNPYCFAMEKKGRVEGYEEIDLTGQYTFYAGLPYFLYDSKMEMNTDVTLSLLRNDEMTTNKTFTDVVFPDATGKAHYIALYNEAQMDSLTHAPLADNLPWMGFVNRDKGYGLISIRLDYDNTNATGKPSPLYEPHTKVSLGANEGRYWNRRLIHEHNTLVPKGSRYYERNAYLTLDHLDGLQRQIDDYRGALLHPLEVTVSKP